MVGGGHRRSNLISGGNRRQYKDEGDEGRENQSARTAWGG